MNTLDDAELARRLNELAEWGRPESVPPLPEVASVHHLHDARSGRRSVRRVAVLITTAAAVIAALLVTISGRDPEPPPFVNGTWSTMAPAPIPGRAKPATVWTGTEMIVIGGMSMGREQLRDAAAYDPSTNTWRALPDAPRPVPAGSPAFWVRGEVVVVPTSAYHMLSYYISERLKDPPPPPGPGADQFAPMALDPLTNAWRSLPARDIAAAATVVGNRIVVLGGDGRSVHELDPASGAWRDIAKVSPSLGWWPSSWGAFTLSGDAAFFAMDQIRMSPGQTIKWIGLVVDPASGRLIELPPAEVEPHFVQTGAIAAQVSPGELMVLNVDLFDGFKKGRDGRLGPDYRQESLRFDIKEQQWVDAPEVDFLRLDQVQTNVVDFVSVSGGAALIGGIPVDEDRVSGLRQVYLREQDRWYSLPEPPIDLGRSLQATVWARDQLLVWGGAFDRAGPRGYPDTPAEDGAVYRPGS